MFSRQALWITFFGSIFSLGFCLQSIPKLVITAVRFTIERHDLKEKQMDLEDQFPDIHANDVIKK